MNLEVKNAETELIKKFNIVRKKGSVDPYNLEQFYGDELGGHCKKFILEVLNSLHSICSNEFEVCNHLIYFYNFDDVLHNNSYELYYDENTYESLECLYYEYFDAFKTQGIKIDQSFPFYDFNESINENGLNGFFNEFLKELRSEIINFAVKYSIESFFVKANISKDMNVNKLASLKESFNVFFNQGLWFKSLYRNCSPMAFKCITINYLDQLKRSITEDKFFDEGRTTFNDNILFLIELLHNSKNSFLSENNYEKKIKERYKVSFKISDPLVEKYIKSENRYEKMFVHSPLFIKNDSKIEAVEKTKLLTISSSLKQYYCFNLLEESLKILNPLGDKILSNRVLNVDQKHNSLVFETLSDPSKYNDVLKGEGVFLLEKMNKNFKNELKKYELRHYSIIFFLFNKEEYQLFIRKPKEKEFLKYIVDSCDSSLQKTQQFTPIGKLKEDVLQEYEDYLKDMYKAFLVPKK